MRLFRSVEPTISVTSRTVSRDCVLWFIAPGRETCNQRNGDDSRWRRGFTRCAGPMHVGTIGSRLLRRQSWLEPHSTRVISTGALASEDSREGDGSAFGDSSGRQSGLAERVFSLAPDRDQRLIVG